MAKIVLGIHASYHRCLEIIPHELEDEVVMKGDEIKAYQQIVSFCKRRTTHLKYKALSKAAERSPRARHMNALKPDATDGRACSSDVLTGAARPNHRCSEGGRQAARSKGWRQGDTVSRQRSISRPRLCTPMQLPLR